MYFFREMTVGEDETMMRDNGNQAATHLKSGWAGGVGVGDSSYFAENPKVLIAEH